MFHLAGIPVQDIFATLTDPVVPRGQVALDDYEKAVKMLDDHFEYKPNTAFGRHLFRKNVPARGGNSGSVSSSSAGASGAVHGAYGERTVSEHLRDQVVEQVRDECLRRKLLGKEDLTLQMALDTARQFELQEERPLSPQVLAQRTVERLCREECQIREKRSRRK